MIQRKPTWNGIGIPPKIKGNAVHTTPTTDLKSVSYISDQPTQISSSSKDLRKGVLCGACDKDQNVRGSLQVNEEDRNSNKQSRHNLLSQNSFGSNGKAKVLGGITN